MNTECCAHHGHHHRPPADPGPGDPNADYTCPMHLDVVQKGPGTCPACGMALEPVAVSLDEGPNEELIDMKRRFMIGAVFAIPVMVLAMGEMIPGSKLSNGYRRMHLYGCNFCWQHQSFFGRAGLFLSLAGNLS